MVSFAEFFRKKNVPTMTVRELFEFVTDTSITPQNIDVYLEEAMKVAAGRSSEDVTEQEKIDEEVKAFADLFHNCCSFKSFCFCLLGFLCCLYVDVGTEQEMFSFAQCSEK